MHGGPKDRKYSAKSLAILRATSLAMVLILAIYNILLHYDYGSRSPFYNNAAVYITVAAFILLSAAQYIFKPHTKLSLSINLFLYYILATLSTIFVTGDATATYIFWLIILIATNVVLNTKVLFCGIVYFAVTMMIFCALQPDIDSRLIVSVLAAAILTALAAAFISWLRSVDIVKYSLYEQVKNRERIQREQLSTVVNSINDAIISLGPNGAIRIYNAAALNLLDTNESLEGKRVDDVLHLYDRDGEPIRMSDIIRDLKKQTERDDLSHRFDSGQEIKLYISCSPVRGSYGNDKTPGVGDTILIMRDITKAKTLEEERDEFISVVSHELRTPVTIAEGTLGNLQFLLEKGGDPKSLSSALDSAHEQILYLSGMINDLSTISRAERGVGMEPEMIDVREFMEGMYNKYQSVARNKKLRLDLNLSPRLGQIKTSRMALEEIMQNIVENALKYTQEGSITMIARQDKSDVQFAVRDSGIGVSKSDQKHIFAKFWRSEDYRTRETSGTGLGLHITQQLARLIGTNIELKSRLNHGSEFSFRLSVKKIDKPTV